MELKSKNVFNIFMDCLFDENTPENREKSVIVEGLMNKYGLNPDILSKHKGDIFSMLQQLPKQFQRNGGGGWSFLNACNREDGTQWTGEHKIIEQLLVLGVAIGKAKIQLPRNLWKALPGGMPYFVVLN